MTFAVLLLLFLLEARGTPALLKNSSFLRVRREVDDMMEVKWSGSCSPRLALLRHHQDAMLECEMYAPAGTSLVWFKDETQILPQVQSSRHSPPPPSEGWVAGSAHRRVSRKAPSSPKGVPEVHISTGTYIDCASAIHQGHYTLSVTTPSKHVYARNFTVILTDDMMYPAMTCYLGPERMAQVPRVWQYARRARGKHGGSLLLPCRVLESGVATTTNWYFRGKRLVPVRGIYKHQVLPSGDLLVRKTEPKDAGLYTCTVHNTLKPYLFDRVHTWLIMPRGRTASP